MRGTRPGGHRGSLIRVAETVIELDVSVPWVPPEPPEIPEPRRRLRARWVALATVLAVTLGVLVAGGPRSDAGLLYTIDFQVLRAQASGGRLFVARYQLTGPGPMIEARRASDGHLLWERPAEIQQQLMVAGPDVVVLMSEERSDRGDSSTLVVLDAATGQELWSRSGVRLSGNHSGVLVVEEPTDVPDNIIFDVGEEAGVNRAGPQPRRRFFGLSQRTGATVWEVTVPAGSAVDFSWWNPYQSSLNRFDVLTGAGQLIRRDAGTGAVTATHQLDWSGTSAGFSAGRFDGSDHPDDRIVLYPVGQPGAVVYDLGTGRMLFRWAGERHQFLFRCTDRLFCSTGDDGLDAVDDTTGAHRWHVDGHHTVLGSAGARLVVGGFRDPSVTQPTPLSVVDSRTGTVVQRLDGWSVLDGGGDRPLLWRAVDKRTAVLGELDPATGLVAVFARASDWFGNPECSVDGRTLACVVVGGLSVWRLPNRH